MYLNVPYHLSIDNNVSLRSLVITRQNAKNKLRSGFDGILNDMELREFKAFYVKLFCSTQSTNIRIGRLHKLLGLCRFIPVESKNGSQKQKSASWFAYLFTCMLFVL